jgi:hypothetical protein
LLLRLDIESVQVNVTIHLDATGLGRGHYWINGFNLGRFWTKTCGSGMCQQ